MLRTRTARRKDSEPAPATARLRCARDGAHRRRRWALLPGALAYATKRPNPAPGIAGYHEVFHGLVVLAAAAHYAAVALALP